MEIEPIAAIFVAVLGVTVLGLAIVSTFTFVGAILFGLFIISTILKWILRIFSEIAGIQPHDSLSSNTFMASSRR